VANIGIALVGAALIVVAAFVVWRERRLFGERDELPARILEYTRARYRRRLAGCSTVVFLGALFAAFPLVPARPRVVEAYWIGIVALVIALVVLAVLDLRETHRQLSRKMSGDELKEFMRDTTDGAGGADAKGRR
jgi:peptidoglycan/LPS O-acetylase OafA/YrhL